MYEQRILIFARQARAELLQESLPRPSVIARSIQELDRLARGSSVAFVEAHLLPQLDLHQIEATVVAIVDVSPAETARETVRLLNTVAGLTHVMSARMIGTPAGDKHLFMLLERIMFGPKYGMVGASGSGRVALVASSRRRTERFERMEAYFERHGVGRRTLDTLHDFAEELVMNALYDAPVEAGFFPTAVSRTEDVQLPHDRSCEVAYGIDADTAFVRVRDSFGAFTRDRLYEVLDRCSQDSVAIDESRGGAGLGLWRILSAASTVAVSVVPGEVTDILATVPVRGRAKELDAIHLFFAPTLRARVPVIENDIFESSVSLVLIQ